MNDTIAIDFGTMRTKLSYLDPQRNSVELMRLGQDERSFIPSIFFLGEDGRRLCGDEAAEYRDSDPQAFLRRPLKRDLQEQWVRAGNREKATPIELLSLLFAGLRNRTKEIPHFRDTLPVGLSLTIPAQYGPPAKQILAEAARNAGFTEDRISFVDEPIAAAQAWLTELGGQEEHVIVLDCGGGTLDWACLHRTDGNSFSIIPDLPPGGDNRLGGFDIDEAIYALIDDAISDKAVRAELQSKHSLVLDQIRLIKERFSRTGSGGRISIGNQHVEISSEILGDIVNKRYIVQACLTLSSYLEKVRTKINLDTPAVLLVGGSAKLRGFKEAITEQCKCNAVWWERSEYATVLGALANVTLSGGTELPNCIIQNTTSLQQSNDLSCKEIESDAYKSTTVQLEPSFIDISKERLAQKLLSLNAGKLAAGKIAVGDAISGSNIINAWSEYARAIPVSDALVQHDDTWFGTGKKGLLASASRVCLSDSSSGRWSAEWKCIRWLCAGRNKISFDQVEYCLAKEHSLILYESLDKIHKSYRTPKFYAEELLQKDFCRSLLACQLLPITSVFGQGDTAKVIIARCNNYLVDNADKFLIAVINNWVCAKYRGPLLNCIDQGRNEIRKEMCVLQAALDAISQDYQRLNEAIQPKPAVRSPWLKGGLIAAGVVGALATGNKAIALAARDYAYSETSCGVPEPITDAWQKLLLSVVAQSKTMQSIIDEQMKLIERIFGKYFPLFDGVDLPRLYSLLSIPCGCEPLALSASSKGFLANISPIDVPDGCQVLDLKMHFVSILKSPIFAAMKDGLRDQQLSGK
ncbi:MAG: Hsp70 family protein [bacterium]